MRRQSNANSYLLCKDAADGRAWAGLVWSGSGRRACLSHRDGETRASGCHAPGEMMLGVLLPSRNGYVILETGNETKRPRPPLTLTESVTVQYKQQTPALAGSRLPVCVVCVRPGD